MSTDTSVSHKTALEFKSTALNVPTLLLNSDNLTHIEHQLEEKIAQAPEFFKNSALLIDLQEVNKAELDIDLTNLVQLLRKLGFFPVGFRGANLTQKASAVELQLPVHASTTAQKQEKNLSDTKIHTAQQPNPVSQQTRHLVENKLLIHPVRSGQRVYAKGDLIITATVSAGAEILAEGNIHVYGALRGRALAGVQGDKESRIFCYDLQAELIAIAGNYKISDELDDSIRHKPVQISLENQALIITPI